MKVQVKTGRITLRYFDDGRQVLGKDKSRERGKQDGVHWEEAILDQTYTMDGWNGSDLPKHGLQLAGEAGHELNKRFISQWVPPCNKPAQRPLRGSWLGPNDDKADGRPNRPRPTVTTAQTYHDKGILVILCILILR